MIAFFTLYTNILHIHINKREIFIPGILKSLILYTSTGSNSQQIHSKFEVKTKLVDFKPYLYKIYSENNKERIVLLPFVLPPYSLI